jgi:hypothetical protein
MMARLLSFSESRQCDGKRRPGLAKPGDAFRIFSRFRSFVFISSLCDVFPHVTSVLQGRV